MKRLQKTIAIMSMTVLMFTGCSSIKAKNETENKDWMSIEQTEEMDHGFENPNKKVDYSNVELKKIYLAGGCFWGLEAYLERIYGVADAVSGYANGTTENLSYEDLVYRNSGHAETVEVTYDPSRVSLERLLMYYLKVIDPTSLIRAADGRVLAS